MSSDVSRFINRELSWLEFDNRVLEEAFDSANPPLERLKFLLISASNLDEFFMVRVGGLQLLKSESLPAPDTSGQIPSEQLEAISRGVHAIVAEQYRCLQELIPLLNEAGIRRLTPGQLSAAQRQYVEQLFDAEISALLTPMAVDGSEGFPLLMGLRLYLAVRLKPGAGELKPRFAIIPLGPGLNRVITLRAAGGYQFMLLEDLVAAFAERLFPGEQIAECVTFRLTRNADLSVNEDGIDDLLMEMESVLDARTQSGCVRLEVDEHVTGVVLSFLQKVLAIGEVETYRIPGPLQLAGLFNITGLDGYEKIKYPPWPPQMSPEIDPRASIFEQISRQDLLLYHPYESYEPVLRLIQEAAADPDVLAIKQILYRTSKNSPVIAALQKAAESGKYVTALVELKARFDEARNIEWARRLEQAGVQVIYGVKGLKTHAKIAIIVRREPRGIVRYLHFGTGNYNELTAQQYGDISYMTCNEDLGRDAGAFFNAITGYSQPQKFLQLSMAPIGLRERLVQLIQSEAERKRHGQKALIMAKLNALVDPEIIDALYAASQVGTKIMLNVRGICCLRPGVPGLSENITVTSIVDRYLEHARILYFHHGGEELMFISSADWMPRNLSRRIELLTPIEEPRSKQRLKGWLETHFQDTVKSRRLRSDGTYERLGPVGKRKPLRSQEELYRQVCSAIVEARQKRGTIFEPHKPPEADY